MSAAQPIVENLWSDTAPADYDNVSKGRYYEHLFEQYKLYVESAHKISDRRNLANSFFLTLHTLLIGIAGFAFKEGTRVASSWLLLFPLLAALTVCYVWWRLIKSYRQLNTAKFRVIGEYERLLPSSPFWRAEWTALGSGTDPKLYIELTKLEDRVPVVFGLIYIILTVAIILAVQ